MTQKILGVTTTGVRRYVNVDDDGYLQTKEVGVAAPSIDSVAGAAINLAANTDNQELVAAPGASKQIWVYGVFARADGATVLSFIDEDDTVLSGLYDLVDGGEINLPPSGNFAMPWFKVPTGKALDAKTVGATTTVDGNLLYAIVSV